jgi:hypothetical protein
MAHEWTDVQRRFLFCAAEGSSQTACDIMAVKHTLLAVMKEREEAATDGVLCQMAQIELVSTMATAAMALEQIGGEHRQSVQSPLQHLLNSLLEKESN